MTIIQKPNLPLLLIVISWILTLIFKQGLGYDLAHLVFIIAVAVWCYLEIFHGVNWFRRLLGIAVLAALVRGLVK